MKKSPRGAAGTDLLLFVLFLIVLGVVWVFTGGPERPISHGSPFLDSPLGENGIFGIPTVGGNASTTNDGSIISRVNNTLSGLQAGEEKSPYAEYVSLSISTAKQESPNEEYVTIKTSRTLSGTLTISDWRLESTVSGVSVTLGTASALPYFGQVNGEVPVAVSANTTVYITTGHSPIGSSFRLNSCTGYFEQHQDFEPRLPVECPLPILELNSASKKYGVNPAPACSSYISGLKQCETQTEVPSAMDSTCRSVVLSDLTYNGCVALHQGDADFYKSEWRLYLRQNQELWKQKGERIRLLDEAGRVIDVVSY